MELEREKYDERGSEKREIEREEKRGSTDARERKRGCEKVRSRNEKDN